MKKKIAVFIICTMIISLFSGCGKKQPEFASSMTIGQLKNKYNMSTTVEQNEMSPFWNVDKDATFKFHFNSNVEPALAVTVHTDPECKETSRVIQLNAAYSSDSGIDVVVKPGIAVLEDENQETTSWGSAPIYYLSINYDRMSSSVEKLDKPVIVPFTVKSDVSTPTARGYIDENGQFSLEWTPIKKAVSYEIYELAVYDRDQMPEEAKTLSSEELCYYHDGLNKIATTSDTSFSTFTDENNLKKSDSYIDQQNCFEPQTYLVKAIDKKGRTSNFSTAVDAWKYTDEMPSKIAAEEITKFTDSINVTMKDGSTIEMPIDFKKEVEGYEETSFRYEVPGTLLSGTMSVKKEETIEEESPEETTKESIEITEEVSEEGTKASTEGVDTSSESTDGSEETTEEDVEETVEVIKETENTEENGKNTAEKSSDTTETSENAKENTIDQKKSFIEESTQNSNEHISLYKTVTGLYEIPASNGKIPDKKIQPRTKFQKNCLKLNKKVGLSTYKKDFRQALVNYESERLSNHGIATKSYEEFIKSLGNFKSNHDTAEPSKEKKLNEPVEFKPTKSIPVPEEITESLKPKEEDSKKQENKDETIPTKEISEDEKVSEEGTKAEVASPDENKEDSANNEETVQTEEGNAVETESNQETNSEEVVQTQEESSEVTEQNSENSDGVTENTENNDKQETSTEQTTEKEPDLNANRAENPFIDEANSEPVPDVHFRLFVNTAEEEYIARMLMIAIPEFSIQGFPSLQNPEHLHEVIQEVIIQNPYIMGVSSYEFNAKKNNVSVNYAMEQSQIYNRQKEANAMMTTLLSASVREGMTEDERALAIYNKLEDETLFDTEAYDALAKKRFRGIDNKHKDSYNIYGLLCKKKGLAHTYTQAYKLLLVESKVQTETVLGTYAGKAHSWNILNIGEKWYWYDLAANGKNSNTPYLLFRNSTEAANNMGYKLKADNEYDNSLTVQENNSKNFYTKNELIVKDSKELLEKVIPARTLMNRNGIYAVYAENQIEITPELIIEVKKLLDANKVEENEIRNLTISQVHNLIIFNENAK